MRHRKAGRQLGRNASHRLSLMRNLTMALIRHERIITTVEKAKEVRPFVEKLITLARKGTLHARRLAMARLGPPGNAEVTPGDGADADHRRVLTKLFDDLGPRFKDRPGGYTRIIKRSERRLGDGGRTAFIELLKEGETKVRARPTTPRPQIEDEEREETPAPPEGKAETPATPETPGAPDQPAGQGEASAPEQTPPAGGNPPKA